MSVEIITRFNGGIGGASIEITHTNEYAFEDGEVDKTKSMSAFVSPQRARELALDLLRGHITESALKLVTQLVNDHPSPAPRGVFSVTKVGSVREFMERAREAGQDAFGVANDPEWPGNKDKP